MTKATFRVALSESIPYSVDVQANDADHAREVVLSLWHNYLQAFRPISDGDLADIVVERIYDEETAGAS